MEWGMQLTAEYLVHAPTSDIARSDGGLVEISESFLGEGLAKSSNIPSDR
jgi:hypothetical protein